MKETFLNSLYFLPNFVPFYMIFFCYLLQYMNMRNKSKRWLVDFPTFIAVTLEHIHILIMPA